MACSILLIAYDGRMCLLTYAWACAFLDWQIAFHIVDWMIRCRSKKMVWFWLINWDWDEIFFHL